MISRCSNSAYHAEPQKKNERFKSRRSRELIQTEENVDKNALSDSQAYVAASPIG